MLCYYFDMKPNEYWNSTYREVNTYSQMHLIKNIDNLRKDVNLEEASTDKLIMADSMSNKHPKIVPIRKTYKGLFNEEKEDKPMTPEEITRKMREYMKNNN